MEENLLHSENVLGTKSIGKLLLELSIPAIIGQLVSLLYNMVDRIFIGHLPNVGGDALTGVGVTMPLIVIIGAFAALVGMGGSPRAAISMGEGNYDEAERILGNSFTALLSLSAIITLFFYFLINLC